MSEFKVKVGDILIPNDEFYYTTGCKEFEVIEIIPYKMEGHVIGGRIDNTYGVKIRGLVKSNNVIGGDYTYYRNMMTCEFKINPPNLEVNIDWTWYSEYCKAIFWTSEKEKQEWYKKYNELKMNQHLDSARRYGYAG